MKAIDIGKFGEKYAVSYLKNRGYSIITTNFYSSYGEIDIIAQKDKYIIFIEVKTRKYNFELRPSECVDKRKRSKIIKTASIYLIENANKLQPRFDVIEIRISYGESFNVKEVNHIKNAFYQEEEYAIF